jgi:aspartate racemase
MKPIGLIGGLTYVSTIEYYRYLNQLANEKLGGCETVEVIIHSVNFGDIKKFTDADDWIKLLEVMRNAATELEVAGAGCLLIGANTMHRIADQIQAAIKIPVIHIAEAVAKEIARKGLKKVGLLGTKYTMQLGFYSDHLANYGIETIIPPQEDIDFLNYTIYNEFSRNLFLPETKNRYLKIMSALTEKGAEGMVLGCSEIPILLQGYNSNIPLFDTIKIHAAAGVDHVLSL